MADRGNDVEKASVESVKKAHRAPPPIYPKHSSHSSREHYGNFTETTTVRESMFRRTLDSFKPAPETLDEDGKFNREPTRGFDYGHAAIATANTKMARRLKGRHMQMIAIGGCIGMSLLG